MGISVRPVNNISSEFSKQDLRTTGLQHGKAWHYHPQVLLHLYLPLLRLLANPSKRRRSDLLSLKLNNKLLSLYSKRSYVRPANLEIICTQPFRTQEMLSKLYLCPGVVFQDPRETQKNQFVISKDNKSQNPSYYLRSSQEGNFKSYKIKENRP